MDERKAITDFSLSELEEEMIRLDVEKYRAKQILEWVYRRRARSFEEMTNLSGELRETLSTQFRFHRTREVEQHESPDHTEKILLELEDGGVIETVLIRENVRTKTGAIRERKTVCVSTQVGCPMACVFCASGLNGLKRNLRSGEIVEQVLAVLQRLKPEDRINNLVLMGIGEPLLNYDGVVQSLRALKASWGGGIGYNRVTLSTVGIIERLKDLVRDKVTPNLALSLHAPNDEVRAKVVPTMTKISVDTIIEGGLKYKKKTNKDVTFEYVLLEGVNDSPEHARELGKRVSGTRCKVNVIPFNRVAEVPYQTPSRGRIDQFVSELGACGVPITVRKQKGDEVAAACGQLRARWEKEGPQPTEHGPRREQVNAE